MTPRLSLLRWLGPWAGDHATPRGVAREQRHVPGGSRGPLRVYRYRPAGEPVGAYLIAPGIHFLGADDPRFDRFCRILARAGFLVDAPFLPDHVAMKIAASATDDLAVAFDALERDHARPAVFSISFGSLPAIGLAARESHRDRVGGVVLFGGFCDFRATLRFCLTGQATFEGRALTLPHDPLNAPVVWLHFLDLLSLPCDRAVVERAYREMVHRTWGKKELKVAGARDAIAHEIAARLGPDDRRVFLLGCGLGDEDPAPVLDAALDAAGPAFSFADPRPMLPRIAAPLTVVHGREDDVIPWCEADKLVAARHGAPTRKIVTGLYAHTGASLPTPQELASELAAMVSLLGVLGAPTGR